MDTNISNLPSAGYFRPYEENIAVRHAESADRGKAVMDFYLAANADRFCSLADLLADLTRMCDAHAFGPFHWWLQLGSQEYAMQEDDDYDQEAGEDEEEES